MTKLDRDLPRGLSTFAHPRVPAFTLIELLVVIGIIGVLISLLLPVLRGARVSAQTVQCASNLRQLGIVLQTYANDNNGWIFPVGPPEDGKPSTLGIDFPPHLRWPMRISGLVPDAPLNPLPYDPTQYQMRVYDPQRFPIEPFTPKILVCPADENPKEFHSYTLNQHLADKHIRVAVHDFGGLTSADVVVAGEKKSSARDYYLEKGEFDLSVERYRHGLKVGSNYLFFDGHVSTAGPTEVIGGLDPWEPPLPDATSQPAQH